MPGRKLPDSIIKRLKAMQTGKERKDAVPAPTVIPYTAGTIAWLDAFYPAYKLKVETMEARLADQTTISNTVKTTRHTAELFISHFYQAMQNGVLRGTYENTVRAYYGLDTNDSSVPVLNSEADITFWHNKAVAGEAARIAAGGTAIPFPTIGEVNTAVNAFKAANQLQANAKDAYDTAQEAVEADNPEADRLILKMWNETETAFDTGNKPSMRRKAREWGVVYSIASGEVLSPEEFSIAGKIREEGAGSTPVVDDVQVTVIETNTIVFTNNNGDYLVPFLTPGSYTLLVEKPNFVSKTINGVTVVAGAITELNIQLTPTGAIEGTAMQNGLPVVATIEVLGTLLSTATDGSGNYYLGNIPAGQHTIRCTITGSNPSLYVDQIVTVNAGGALSVNFVFP